MAVCIIEKLESINVYHNQRQRRPLPCRLIFQALLYSKSKALLFSTEVSLSIIEIRSSFKFASLTSHLYDGVPLFSLSLYPQAAYLYFYIFLQNIMQPMLSVIRRCFMNAGKNSNNLRLGISLFFPRHRSIILSTVPSSVIFSPELIKDSVSISPFLQQSSSTGYQEADLLSFYVSYPVLAKLIFANPPVYNNCIQIPCA